MTRHQRAKIASIGILRLIVLTSLSTIAFAQTVKINGLIKARSGAGMIVQTSDSPKLIVVLTDSTQVDQIQGVLKVRRKEMSMAALIPGLAVQVEGTYNELNQLVAKSVKFKGNDLEQAQSIQAGLHETKVRTQQNEEELEKQSAALKTQQEELATQQQNISANKATIDAAIARFGQLDDYYILDEVSVYFANGKVDIDPQFKPQLTQLAEKARTVEAYMIQVIGYASSVGSATLNQKLSEDRAHNIANFLVQEANVPLTNLLAPGAMGESRPVADDNTAEGQAQNRRVVVRVLQNKGIAGLKGTAH
jgi:outer membrane protein OmpA-like peptidoglycan-associated protein